MAESDWLNVQRNKTTGQYRTKQGGGGGASSLIDLDDTNITNPSNEDTLKYNSTTQKWENKEDSLANLSDVSLNSPSDGDILRYNAQSGEWENAVMPDSYHVYSTTEHIVGEWIDGRLIYERTWDFGSNKNISNNSWTTTTAQKSGIAFLISCKCATENGGACWSDIAASIEVVNTYIALQCMRNGDTSNVRYMTLQYLKS